MKPPTNINIKSDGNVLEFVEMLTPIKSKQTFYMYRYKESKTKKGNLLGLTEIELEKLIKLNAI